MQNIGIKKLNILADGNPIPFDHFFLSYNVILPFAVDNLIADVAFYQWPGSDIVSCKIRCHNGHCETGTFLPRSYSQSDLATGIEGAFLDAREKLWPILSYQEYDGV